MTVLQMYSAHAENNTVKERKSPTALSPSEMERLDALFSQIGTCLAGVQCLAFSLMQVAELYQNVDETLELLPSCTGTAFHTFGSSISNNLTEIECLFWEAQGFIRRMGDARK